MQEIVIPEIKLMYIEDILPIQQYGDWIDLRCAKRIELDAGDYIQIPLGVAMELPKGYEAHILPRSSTYKKWGIIPVNSVGIIDNDYNGYSDEWKFPVLALRKTTIHKNDRICQFRIYPTMPFVNIHTVKILENDNRGGFGSTGEK